MSTATLTLADLRTIDLFDDLDDAALETWLDVVVGRDVAPGEIVAEQDEAPAGVFLIFDGRLQMTMVDGERTEPVSHQEGPTWTAAIAVLTEGALPVRMTALTECRIAVVPSADFRRLALAQPAVHRRVMAQVAPVMGAITAVEQNRERLASLGTMAAGLAHELNNPAAAAERAAAQMADALDVIGSTVGHFVDAGLERSDAKALVELHRAALTRAAGLTALGALDASDAEDALLDALDDLGVEQAWRLAEPLASAGLDREWLERVAAVARSALEPALAWVAASLTARGLAGELQESTARMSQLVGAVKSYAYMDRGDVVEADVHEGLETTLMVLGHKLKHTSIEVVRDYDRSLPKLMMRGSELNQVWTNLLDNAIDALGERGTITVRTRRDGPCVRVDIADDGPGVAPEVRDRIFDSFVTTKDVGKGTGLGLPTARRIVVDRHDGSLTVESRPGATTFSAWLPLPPG